MENFAGDETVRVAVRIRQKTRNDTDPFIKCGPNGKIFLNNGKQFTFDYVYDPCAKQAEILNSDIDRMVERSLEGYNGTVLAYGQTGSGKTFTMGSDCKVDVEDSLQGIIPRALRMIFSRNVNSDKLSIHAQFLEIYKGKIYDLLDPETTSKRYEIRLDKSRVVYVSGATKEPINCLEDAIRCLQRGALTRTTGKTKMNSRSSRSHAFFTVFIRCRRRKISTEILTSKFHFVDLAGPERLDKNGFNLREIISINMALHELSNVIAALVNKNRYIPYRNSILTRILQDSLGGNSTTVLIACVSSSKEDCNETLDTLVYANSVKNIENHLHKNQDRRLSLQEDSSLQTEKSLLQLENSKFIAENLLLVADNERLVADTERLIAENERLDADNKRLVADNKRLVADNKRLVADNERMQLQRLNSQANTEKSIVHKPSKSENHVIDDRVRVAQNTGSVAEAAGSITTTRVFEILCYDKEVHHK